MGKGKGGANPSTPPLDLPLTLCQRDFPVSQTELVFKFQSVKAGKFAPNVSEENLVTSFYRDVHV